MAGSKLRVNGTERRLAGLAPDRPLLGVLREELRLTGAKYGCGEGQCGACTVLVDGRPARACITPVGGVAGKAVTTIEGVAGAGGGLHPLQQAFIDEGAMQCGYCTPGMIIAALALLARNPDPSEAEVARGLQGNICRCGVHPRIVAAVRRAATALRVGAAGGGAR